MLFRSVISGPTYKGVLVPVAKGSEITINSVAENGVYEFKAITQEVRREPIYQLDLDVPADEPIHHLQRRQFMRLNLHLRVTYQILSNNQNVPDESSKKMEAMSKDISGNGICLIMDERLPKGTRLDMFVPLLPDRPPIYVVGEIVRADDPHGETHRKNYDVGIRFVEIRLTDQDRIVKYVFEQERKRAQKLGR